MNRRSLPSSLALLTITLATRMAFASEPTLSTHCTPQGHDKLGERFRTAIAEERFADAGKYLQIAANCELLRLKTVAAGN